MDPSERLVSQLEFHPTRPEEERIGKSCTFAIARAAQDGAQKKSRAMRSPAPKIVSTLFTRCLDLILIGGATLLLRVRVPPETWTTRPGLAASLSPNS